MELWLGLEDEFGDYDFPIVGSEAGLVLRVGALAVPGGDGEDGGEGAAHAVGRAVAGGEGSYYCSVAVEELPAVLRFSELEAVAGREGGDGAVYSVARRPVSGEAEEDVA